VQKGRGHKWREGGRRRAEGGGGYSYARHMRAAVPEFMAMMSPLFNPNNTKPLADSTGGVTTVAPLAEVCRSACKTAGVSRRMQGRMVT
jgi:hypothetical protein